jgi:enoyl-CoA hydratase
VDNLGVRFEEENRCGVVTFDRPERLNALTLPIVEALSDHYRRWARDPHIYGVVMQSNVPGVFCSGGNLKILHDLGQRDRAAMLRFYRAAYAHEWLLERFVKPNVPLIDGLVVGGGVGFSLYGTHRVAGDGYRFAIPQVGIGFIPDSGASYFLAQMPGQTGMYLALTGSYLGAADAFRLGLVTHCIPTTQFDVIRGAMREADPIDPLLDGLHKDPGEGELVVYAPTIERIFSASSVEETLSRLDSETGEHADWAKATAAIIRKKSPTSVKIAFRQVRMGRTLDLATALALEFRLTARLIESPDLYEGMRCAVIEKGRKPAWSPETIEAVNEAEIDELFAAEGPDLELETD